MALTYLGKKEVRINKAQYIPSAPKYRGIPGAVVGVESDGCLIKTGDSYIKITEGYVIGDDYRLKIGDRLK